MAAITAMDHGAILSGCDEVGPKVRKASDLFNAFDVNWSYL